MLEADTSSALVLCLIAIVKHMSVASRGLYELLMGARGDHESGGIRVSEYNVLRVVPRFTFEKCIPLKLH